MRLNAVFKLFDRPAFNRGGVYCLDNCAFAFVILSKYGTKNINWKSVKYEFSFFLSFVKYNLFYIEIYWGKRFFLRTQEKRLLGIDGANATNMIVSWCKLMYLTHLSGYKNLFLVNLLVWTPNLKYQIYWLLQENVVETTTGGREIHRML